MASDPNSVIVVPSPAPGSVPDIRDIKPPLEIGGSVSWIWWAGAVLLLSLAAFFIVRRRRNRRQPPPLPPVTPPHVVARQRLQQALSLLSDPKAFCVAVSDAIRWYLEIRFHFHAPERTTEEFLLELQDQQVLLPDQKQSLGEFLQVCDLVKFARHEPNELVLRDLHEAALRLVDETQFDTAPTQTGTLPKSPMLMPEARPAVDPARDESVAKASEPAPKP